MERDLFLKKLERIEELPTLPTIAMDVNKMLQDYDNTTMKKLSDRIEKDQAIVSKILKLANSAFFGIGSKVTTIPRAITLLGFNTVRNAVISVSIMDAFPYDGELNGFDIKEFWRHSVAVAVIARYIASETKIYSPDDCFIGGLLHDIGKVILAQHFPDVFKRIYKICTSTGECFFEIEKEETPVNHSYIGFHLTKKWRLPMALVDVIRYHHTLSKNALEMNFVIAVSGADAVYNSFNNYSGGINLSNVSAEIKKSLGKILQTSSEWYPPLSRDIEDACSFFMEDLKQ